MSAATLAPPMQTVLHPRLVCTIAGRPVDVLSFDAQHGVNQPIGTATVTLPLPLPPHMQGADGNVLNQRIEIKAGYEDGVITTRFSGRIDSDRMTIDEREMTATLSARGWATLLDWEEETDLVFPPATALHDIIRSLCQWRGVPAFRIDPIIFPDASAAVIVMGGNRQVDNGEVIIPKRTSPLSWIDRKCRLFGYRIFDTPSGELRVQRVSGAPTGRAVATYREGVNVFNLERTRDLKPMVTYWTVEGATYTDADGVQIPIRSIPESVPYNPLLNPPGYRAGRLSDRDLAYVSLARVARNIAEIDHAAPYRELRWEAPGDPARHPGDVVSVVSSTMGHNAAHWLMSVRERLDSRDGYIANFDAWAGGGSVLPIGTDLHTIPVQAAAVHIGDEYLSHYEKPAPSGTSVTIPFTVPDDFASIAVSGLHHGTNSFLIDGANTDANVSKVEVFQNGESVGSSEMPVSPEDLLLRRDYRQRRYWQPFRMPVPGRLEPGPAELRFISGEDSRGGIDDYEIADVVLELRGVGKAALPTPRRF